MYHLPYHSTGFHPEKVLNNANNHFNPKKGFFSEGEAKVQQTGRVRRIGKPNAKYYDQRDQLEEEDEDDEVEEDEDNEDGEHEQDSSEDEDSEYEQSEQQL